MKPITRFFLLLGFLSITVSAADAPYEPKRGSAERKAIMDAMRVPTSRRIGKPVTFTGNVLVVGEWACFNGSVATTDGKPPESDDAKYDLEFDFFALLRRANGGGWAVLHSGFAGDYSVTMAAQERFPNAPKVLFR